MSNVNPTNTAGTQPPAASGNAKNDPMIGSKTMIALGSAITAQTLARSPDQVAGTIGNLNIQPIQIGQNSGAPAAQPPLAKSADKKEENKGSGLTINYGKPKEPEANSQTPPPEGTPSA